MKTLTGSIAALSMLAMATVAGADTMYLGTPSYGGTGCPGGTVGVALAPDQKSFSMLFDQYVVQPENRRNAFDRKACTIAVPIHVPQGYSFSILEINYRGFADIPAGGYARLGVNYFLSGGRSVYPRPQEIYGAFTGEYVKNDRLGIESVIWSPCGKDVILNANSNVYVRTNGRGDQAMATVDSVDGKVEVKYQIQWKSCQ